jgi:alpha-L-rhamnosidase
MAIYYDVFDEAEKQKAFEVLVDIIEEGGEYIDFGFVGIMSIFRVLCEYGRADLAFKMIARPDYPSFGCWVKRGYTALAANFHPDGEFPDSLNHHCFGEISAIFIEYFAGIRVNPYLDNCKEVNIEPCFVPQLTNAKAYHDTEGGRISVSWERNGGEIKLIVEKADELFGEIKLPAGYVFKDTKFTFKNLQSGEYTVLDMNYQDEHIIEV